MGAKVYVGLSGGVDSSTAAALLKREGYDVTGVFIKVWHPEFLTCTWPEERRSAIAAAAAIGIPFETLDLENEYKQHIVDYMIAEYRKGRTPNPDVMCNQHIKFGGFFHYAMEHGADFVATGHYARRVRNQNTGTYELHEGVDANKDQSYFLWRIRRENIARILFPLGEYEKSEVRKMARKFKLPTAEKKDSQGLCFLGKVDMKSFLTQYIPEHPGDVLSEEGEVIGTHDGAAYYTIGQRHGFLITTRDTKRKRHYVVAKDVDKNTITVSETKERTPYNPKIITLSDEHWLIGKRPDIGNYEARIRYRGERQRCYVDYEGDILKVRFQHAQLGIAPGQSFVLYEGTHCLGGGIIER